MKETKEQLAIKVSKLESRNTRMSDEDERLRVEFARAFHYWKPQEMYMPISNEPSTPSWEQIFVELGKLISARTFYDLEGNVSELECKLEDLESKIKKEIHPNI